MKRLLQSSIILMAFCISGYAQDIEVKSLKTISEYSTNAGVRKDNNGAPSGLVRVQLKEAGAQFGGNILGDVEYKNGEYWVYMSTGSKRLSIKHPDFLPITVVFSTLGVNKVVSGAEYQMLTKATKEKTKAVSNKKGIVAFQITPFNATLSIDGSTVSSEDDGQYSLSLPYGTHYYSVSHNNFSIENQAVKIDKQLQVINVDLTEYFAKLSVTSQESDASIYINDELRGVGSCEELMAPGEYIVQARKDGCHPASQTIILEDNEDFTLCFPQMKAIAGVMRVDYDPIGTDVYLDGRKIGVTPLKKDDVLLGQHTLRLEKKNCTPETRNIIISEEKELVVKGMLEMPYDEYLYSEIAKGNGCAMIQLGVAYTLYGSGLIYSIYGVPGCSFECLDISKGLLNKNISKVASEEFNQDFKNMTYEERLKKGIYLFNQALNANYSNKKHGMIAKCFATIGISVYYACLGNDKESFQWANKGYNDYPGSDGIPALNLAWHYYYGRGVTKDVTKAKQLLKGNEEKLELLTWRCHFGCEEKDFNFLEFILTESNYNESNFIN